MGNTTLYRLKTMIDATKGDGSRLSHFSTLCIAIIKCRQKVALIGEEGNGKTTLLKAIADPDSISSYVEVKGNIYKSDEIIGYLPQVIPSSIMNQSTYDYFNQRVENELRSVSRQAPSVGKNLKDKMHSVKSMGGRFEREKENLTKSPDFEDGILVQFDSGITIANGKQILDFHIDSLEIGKKISSNNINLQIFGPKKICIVGK